MVNWNFNPNDVKEVSFEPAPAGDTRVKIVSMEEKNHHQVMICGNLFSNQAVDIQIFIGI